MTQIVPVREKPVWQGRISAKPCFTTTFNQAALPYLEEIPERHALLCLGDHGMLFGMDELEKHVVEKVAVGA